MYQNLSGIICRRFIIIREKREAISKAKATVYMYRLMFTSHRETYLVNRMHEDVAER